MDYNNENILDFLEDEKQVQQIKLTYNQKKVLSEYLKNYIDNKANNKITITSSILSSNRFEKIEDYLLVISVKEILDEYTFKLVCDTIKLVID
jgi:hypothetical protein